MFSKSIVGLFFALVLGGCAGTHTQPAAQQQAALTESPQGSYVEAKLPVHGRRVPPRIQRFDANHDGVLQASEVPPRLREWFAKVDANKDGIVTAQEIRAWNRQHRHHGPRPQPQTEQHAQGPHQANELAI